MDKLFGSLDAVLSASRVRLREAQSALGLVYFVGTCCPPARLLLNSFTDALRGRDRHD